jgi:hypothetical protein
MIAGTSMKQLYRCLEGVKFPANREQLLAAVCNAQCDKATLDAVRDIPRITYNTVEQVSAAVNILT